MHKSLTAFCIKQISAPARTVPADCSPAARSEHAFPSFPGVFLFSAYLTSFIEAPPSSRYSAENGGFYT